MMEDKYFMKLALTLAKKGAGYTAPNPMVGAVVVKDKKVIGKGWHKAYGSHHAEVNAIDDAGKSAKGAELYVTLEPCNHHGKTPPCTEKIINAGITKVIIASKDPNPDVCGGGIKQLEKMGVSVVSGVCQKESDILNEAFIKYVKTKQPFVSIKCASTLDGFIATGQGNSKWITGEESRKFVHKLRHETDAILTGIKTVKHDDPSLTTRCTNFNGKDPIRIILDTNLSIPLSSKLLNLKSNAYTIIATKKDSSLSKKKQLENMGVKIITLPEKKEGLDICALLDHLGKLKITSLLVEGGSHIISSFILSRAADKIYMFYAPKFIGGNGIPICSGNGHRLMKDSININDISVTRFNDDIMISGYI